MPLKYLAIIITEAVSIQSENYFPSEDPESPTVVECEESIARQVVHSRKAEFLPQESEQDEDRQEQIIDAIMLLDSEEGFGKSGKPNVDSIEEILGFDITAAERDNAWDQMEESE